LGGRKGIRPVKNLGEVVVVGAPLARLGWRPPGLWCLCLHYPHLLHKNPEELFLLVPAYPGGARPKAVKRLLVGWE